MLYQTKEITILRLKDYVPEGMTLEEHLAQIEREALPVTLFYDHSNPHDSNCKLAALPNGDIIGKVNTEGHRYLKKLLERSPTHTCPAQFSEVVRPEGHTPVILYRVMINLEDVEKLEPGKEWKNWDCELSSVIKLRELEDVQRLSAMLMTDFLTGQDKPYYDSLIGKLEKASLYDMSVETTEAFDNMGFLLEQIRTPRSKKLKAMIQHATTVRRTDKQRDKFVKAWWPETNKSEESNRMWQSYLNDLICKGQIKDDGELTQKVVKEELDCIEDALKRLPYRLYDKIENIGELYSAMCYTRIPREKQQKLLSALVIRERLLELKSNKSVNVTNLIVSGMMKADRVNVDGDLMSDNAKKIVNS